MPAESEEWIQSSLARLEAYEELRTECQELIESGDDTSGDVLVLTLMSKLEDKINRLYAKLESAADARDDERQQPPPETSVVGGASPATASEPPPEGLAMPASLTASGAIGDEPRERSKTMTSVPKFNEVQQRYAVVSKAASTQTPAGQTQGKTQLGTPDAAATSEAETPAPAPAPVASHRGNTLHVSPPPQPSPVVAHPEDTRAPARSTPAAPFAFSSTPGAVVPAAALSQPGQPAASGAAPFAFTSNTNNPAMYGASDAYFNNLGFDDDDLRMARRTRPRWGLVAAVVLLGGGVGGYIAYDQYYAPKPAQEPAPTVPVAPRIIKAAEVPPDTQGPSNIAKTDGEVSQTAGTTIQERKRRGRAGRRNLGPAERARPAKRDRNTKVKNTDDPLDGVEGF